MTSNIQTLQGKTSAFNENPNHSTHDDGKIFSHMPQHWV